MPTGTRRTVATALVVGLCAAAAARRKPPPPSYYHKKKTWHETLRVSREALARAEAEAAKPAQAPPPGKRPAAGPKGVRLGPWHRIGPFYNAGKPAFDFAFPPEKEIALDRKYGELAWQECPQFDDGRPHRLRAGTNGSTYLYRTLVTAKARTIKGYFGSDDGLAVWLNGEKVVNSNVRRGVAPNSDQAKLALKAGENRLLLKVYNTGGGHGFYFSTRKKPAAGVTARRRGKDPRQTARQELWSLVARAYRNDPIVKGEMAREQADVIWAADWKEADLLDLARRYAKATRLPSLHDRAEALLAGGVKKPAELTAVRELYVRSWQVTEASKELGPETLESIRLAVKDLARTFPKRYTRGGEHLARLAALEGHVATVSAAAARGDVKAIEELSAVARTVTALRREALLASPLLDFDRLLVIQRQFGDGARKVISSSLGMPSLNSHIHTAIRNPRSGWDDEIAVLTDLRGAGRLTTLFRPEGGRMVCDVDLHFDADRMLLSMYGTHDRWHVFELGADGKHLRQLTPTDLPDVDHFDACYLPNGRIAFTSTATFQGLPCEYGGKPMACLYLLDRKTGDIRQITFEQDSDWCPTVLNNGRLMYLRWEYTDTPHYFTRVLFHCNPDGTGQMEYYGSNSYFPNAFLFARPIPGHPTRVVGIAGGHHGISRSGRMLILDPDIGRHEADGVVQEIPGRGRKVEPIIRDRLVDGVWPQFLHPYPLAEPGTNRGAGRYFLVAAKLRPGSLWGIYLADVFDNLTLVKEVEGCALLEPLPLRRTPRPPVIPPRVDLRRKDAVVYLTDIYRGPSLAGVPRGAVKRLRLISYHYAYNKRGGHSSVGIESSWDIKRVLGTVPVAADGSAYFRVPANTPIAVQPLDGRGRALQLMRSWFVGMPGEVVSCVGCHEPQADSPDLTGLSALRRAPSEIESWYGPARPFGFEAEVQPVLDKYCVACHDGRREGLPNLADTARESTDTAWRATIGKFSNSYAGLQKYVRRPGPEGDYHALRPMEYHASTSELAQMLRKGHHNVTLDREAWERLYTWIDLNAPYHGRWSPDPWRDVDQRERRRELARRYANVDDDPEGEYAAALGALAKRGATAPIKPPPAARPPPVVPRVAGWPFDAHEAARRRAAAGPRAARTVNLGGGLSMAMALIPAGEFVMGDPNGCADERPLTRVRIERPFWMGVTEVTNAQFARFDPAHDSRYIDRAGKDQSVRGWPANGPDQPVIRVTWKDATAFCRWLGEATGRRFALPTEAQWEWACRAGTATPLWYGGVEDDFAPYANLADVTGGKLRTTPFPTSRRLNDRQGHALAVGAYRPNPWGLMDMHGSVAEWTLSLYRRYPYDDTDGRSDLHAAGRRVVRGGSWRDRPKRCRSAFRLAYEPYQPVVNVGFRVVSDATEPVGNKTQAKIEAFASGRSNLQRSKR